MCRFRALFGGRLRFIISSMEYDLKRQQSRLSRITDEDIALDGVGNSLLNVMLKLLWLEIELFLLLPGTGIALVPTGSPSDKSCCNDSGVFSIALASNLGK